MAHFANGFLQGMQGVAAIMRMQQQEEDAKPERELRRLQIDQIKSDMEAGKELKTDLKNAAQFGIVQDGVSTGEQGNRLFNKDAEQGVAVNDMVNAQREMQDQPALPSQKAATVANGIYDSNAAAQEAGLGLNSRADVMQRQGDVYMKHGKADLADTLLSRADALRKEGGSAALQQVMAGADAKTVEDTFNKSGYMKVSGLRIEALPEDPANPGIPQYKVFGKRGTSTEEVDLLGGKDAMTAYTMLQSPDKYIDQIYKNRGEIRADKTLATQENVAKQTIAASRANVDMNKLEFDARRGDAAFNKSVALRGEARDDKRLEATLNPLSTQFNGMEKALGITLTPEMKTRIAGLDKKDDIDEKFIQEIALKGVAAGTLKETDVVSFVTNTTKQLRSAKAWSRDEPQVKQLLNAAAEKGELKEAVSEIKSKFGLSDDWFKANGFDPKNTDLKSYKSSAYLPIEAAAAKAVGVPAEMLKNVRMKGERSNADQVSEAGAKTVYQFTEASRKLFKDKYGVDAYASPADAAKAAAYHLKESLDRHANLPQAEREAKAYAEYHGGTDTKQHGKRTQAYVDRTTQGSNSLSSETEQIGRSLDAARLARSAAKESLQSFGSKQQIANPQGYEAAKLATAKAEKEVAELEKRFSTRADTEVGRRTVMAKGIQQ
jgi:hypothetical protein